MPILLFEDDLVTQLYPISIGKPAFKISCGSFRLYDLLAEMLDSQIEVLVRPHLRSVHAADHPAAVAVRPAREATLIINARLVPSADVVAELQRLQQAGQPCRVLCGTSLAAAVLPAGAELPAADAPPQELLTAIERFSLPTVEANLPLFDYPHDVVRHHLSSLGTNLNQRLAKGQYLSLIHI